MGRQIRPNRDPGRVGILASTNDHARTLAQDFNIGQPLCFSPRSLAQVRGTDLRVLLVHEDCWPLPDQVLEEIRPALKRHVAYAYKVHRHDPHREER
jgi:hypothetical protein